jgi:membrane-associated protease RseP (regulator of RpoE activity)
MGQTVWIFLSWFLGLYFLGLAVGTVAHKAGHLLCARIGSIPLRRMVIGWGPVLVRGSIGDVQVELRLVPLGSWVTCAETANMPKGQAVAFYVLAGILGNVAVIGVIVWLQVILRAMVANTWNRRYDDF